MILIYFKSFKSFQVAKSRMGEMAQWVQALIALEQDLCSFPTHVIPVPGVPTLLPQMAPALVWCTKAYTGLNTHINKIFLKKNILQFNLHPLFQNRNNMIPNKFSYVIPFQ